METPALGQRIKTNDEDCATGTVTTIEKTGLIHILYDDNTMAVYSLQQLNQMITYEHIQDTPRPVRN